MSRGEENPKQSFPDKETATSLTMNSVDADDPRTTQNADTESVENLRERESTKELQPHSREVFGTSREIDASTIRALKKLEAGEVKDFCNLQSGEKVNISQCTVLKKITETNPNAPYEASMSSEGKHSSTTKEMSGMADGFQKKLTLPGDASEGSNAVTADNSERITESQISIRKAKLPAETKSSSGVVLLSADAPKELAAKVARASSESYTIESRGQSSKISSEPQVFSGIDMEDEIDHPCSKEHILNYFPTQMESGRDSPVVTEDSLLDSSSSEPEVLDHEVVKSSDFAHAFVEPGALSHAVMEPGALSHAVMEPGALSHAVMEPGALSHAVVEPEDSVPEVAQPALPVPVEILEMENVPVEGAWDQPFLDRIPHAENSDEDEDEVEVDEEDEGQEVVEVVPIGGRWVRAIMEHEMHAENSDDE